MFLWSVSCLADWGCDPLVLVVPPDRKEFARGALGDGPPVELVDGGDTRQASVANGLEKITTPRVLIHDAARPFVSREVIEAVVRALGDADAAIPVVDVAETLKHLDENHVSRTVDRSGLALAQTPQAFRTEVLKRAHARARSEGFVGTDDAQLIEKYGGAVAVVPGSRTNIKLTYPEDFALAEALMRS